MGLDQSLYVKPNDSGAERQKIAYWRKHANLQGFMCNLWLAREHQGVTAEDFNCVYLSLTRADCEAVIEATQLHSLPYTTGFFFGASTPDQDAYTIEAMRTAIYYLDNGYTVEYYPNW